MLEEDWEKIEWNELGRQKLRSWNFLQLVKQVAHVF